MSIPKERPMLFNGDMVRAVLEDRKTQDRIIVKPQPFGMYRADYEIRSNPTPYFVIGGKEVHCPRGKPGDRLRISEEVKVKPVCEDWYSVHFTADNLHLERACDVGLMEKIKGYKTSHLRGVHLPPAYARPTRLEITGVRVERLNDISEADAIAEGVVFGTGKPNECRTCARGAYMDLWNAINGKDSWIANPWVWVIEFRKLEAAQ